MGFTIPSRCGLLSVALAVAGCGGAHSIVPVSGEVFVDQQPARGAFVVLSPDENAGEALWPNGFPRAYVQSDGTFSVSTNSAGDGAPEGNYTLLVTWPQASMVTEEGSEQETESPPDRLQGRYASREVSTLKTKVRVGNPRLPRIDLSGVPQ